MPTHRVRLVVLAVFALLQAGCAITSKVDVWRVLASGRDGYQQPEKVIAALDLAPGARVAEIGAGDGYWIPWLAEAVGPSGRVYAVEVEEEKVEALRRFVDDADFGNVEVVLGGYEDPLLPDGSIDVAITSKTYHHIDERVVYFRGLHADLAPDGRVAHLDDRPDLPFPLSWLTTGHTSDPAVIEAEMREAGYRRVAAFDFIYPQSFLVYQSTDPNELAED